MAMVRDRTKASEWETALTAWDLLDSYRLRTGASLDLRTVAPVARVFLLDLALRAAQGQSYAELLQRIMSPDAPIYEGRSPIEPGIGDLPAVRVAQDLVYSTGLRQGAIAGGAATQADGGQAQDLGAGLVREAIVTVGEAMRLLGLTRQAVINAARSGRVRGEQHGGLWILSRRDVVAYGQRRGARQASR
jgi:hypothetical protein